MHKTPSLYPVLYLQQRAGDHETGWVRQGNANFILDNLIAAKTCKPMIVVMAYGYAHRTGQAPVDLFAKGFGSPEMLKAMQDMAAAFEDDVTQSLIPYIDSTSAHYPTATVVRCQSLDGRYADLPGSRWIILISSLTSAASAERAGCSCSGIANCVCCTGSSHAESEST